jgi:hypothetical protein
MNMRINRIAQFSKLLEAAPRLRDAVAFFVCGKRKLQGEELFGEPDPSYFYQVICRRNYGDPRRQPELQYGERFTNERMALIWVIVQTQKVLGDVDALDECGEKTNAELAALLCICACVFLSLVSSTQTRYAMPQRRES